MAVETPSHPRLRRFTADEVLRMVDARILHEDEPVELIDGELRIVSPQGWAHGRVTGALNRILGLAYGATVTVRVQMPLGGLPESLPEPDVAVGATDGVWDDERRHPRGDEMLLVVEVAVSSGFVDRRKASLYAETGAPIYWLVDVARRCVSVYEGPRPDGTWERTREIGDGGSLDLPRLETRVAVADILPGGR